MGACSRPPTTARQLVARQKDILDNATPSANSTTAIALTRLAALTGEMRYANHADRIYQLLGTVIGPGGRAQWGNALPSASRPAAGGITEVAIVGDRPDLVRPRPSRCSGPDMVLAWGERYDSPLWHEAHRRFGLRVP